MKILSNKPWVNYIVKTFFRTLNIQKKPDLTISYDREIKKDGIVVFRGSHCKKNLKFKKEKIPIFHENKRKKMVGESILKFEDGSSAVSFDKRNNVIYCRADILQTCFLLLTRKEEKGSPKDEYNRFKYENSYIKEIETPIVNIYFEIMYYLLNLLLKKNKSKLLKKNPWPNNSPYAVCLTHDIDNVYKWYLKKVLSYIKKRKIGKLTKSIGRGEYWNFEKIMDCENKFNVKSTLFFLTIKRDEQPRYNIKRLRKIIEILHENGWEIGLHSGPQSFDSHENMKKEIQKIERVAGLKIKGNRNHYLKYNSEKTWQTLEKNKIIYDSSLGYSDQVGFKSGVCNPYNAYDYNNNKELKTVELPLVFMDNIFEMKDCNEKLNKLVENVKKFNGLIVIDWHLRVFDTLDFPGYTKFYEKLLERFKQDNAFICKCEDVLDIYNKNKKAIEA
ncbi:MAG: polysaccharide deacetylase family protein [Thermoplasmatales archaeon]|nr:MAG: polysaccharide deacetylase family protein [Thermoplasmatales archaeon]